MSMRVGNSSSFTFMGCLNLNILTSPILYANYYYEQQATFNTILLNVSQNCSKNSRISFATRLSSNSRERME